jgi:hypothetical protein
LATEDGRIPARGGGALAPLALLLIALGAAPAGAVSPPLAGGLRIEIQASIPDIVIGEVERRMIGDYYGRNLQLYEQGRYPGYEFDADQGGGNGHGQGKGKGKGKGGGVPPGLAKKGGVPPGLAKKGGLPPGIAQQLARGHPLPPGLDYRPLPGELMRQLPPVPSGYGYRIVDDRVLLVQAATNVILDALRVPALP